MAARTFLKVLLAAAAFPALSGCGQASSELDIQCTAVDLQFQAGATTEYITRIQQQVIATDQGLNTTFPLNNAEVTLYADEIAQADTVGMCAGSFEDCATAAQFKNTLTTKTDGNGILEVFVRLSFEGVVRQGTITEYYGAPSNSCVINYSIATGA